MPPKVINKTVEMTQLVDLPPHYLLDRTDWPEFKRSMNVCGLTWNLPDWMHTIVYKGEDWKKISGTEDGKNLDELFPAPTKKGLDGNELKIGDASSKLIKALGFPKQLGEYIHPSLKFCNLSSLEFEPENKLTESQRFDQL
jgi:hypothetical protein